VSDVDDGVDRRPVAVRTDGLAKSYGDAAALSPIDLEVREGDRVAIIGHNGSGKTTLLRMLAGLLDASEGHAEIAGNAPGSIPARAALSYLADQPVFYDDLSVIEHLEYIARLHGVDDWRPLADELVERVGLTARIDDLPTTFSRGLRQKAAICLAFVRPFEVLIVDEPFVGLDTPGRNALLALFDDARTHGRTLLVATHELTTVATSDRVIALRSGEVVYDGGPDTDLDDLVVG
jgi:ABC-type multidrug transport system ATPase subunit